MTYKLKLSSIDLASYTIITVLCAARLAVNDQLTSIVTDEIQYKEIILGLKEPHLFNPIFYGLYAITKYANEGWYLGVRLLNLIFIYTSTEAIRRICILYKIEGLKRIIVYSTMLCTGITTYMLNVMPECMYIAGIYWIVYFLLKQKEWDIGTTILVSSMASCLSLIKPHAILLYPIIVVTYIWGLEETRTIRVVTHIVLSLAIFTSVRWGLGWVLSEEVSLGLFGGVYETLGNKNIVESLSNTLYVVNRHTFSWILITPFVATWLYILIKGITTNKFDKREKMLHIFTSGALISSIIAFSMFTASVNTNENMQILRIHLRYYSFIVPIVVISAIKIEGVMDQLVKRREVVVVNGFILVTILAVNLILEDVYTIRGNWIDSPILINISSGNDILFWCAMSIIFIMTISISKSITIPIFYTAALLILAEMRQWNVSYNVMKSTREETELHNYIELKTNGNTFNVLVQGRNSSSQNSTRNEMINCIKIAMLQTKRTFKDMCIKKTEGADKSHLLAFKHLDYGLLLEDYCELEEIKPAESNGMALLIKKDFRWKDVDINTNNKKEITMIGFHEQESWGRWAEEKWTRIKPRKYISGNVYLEFKARSLLDSEIRIRDKVVRIDRDWKRIRYNIEKIDCLDSIGIEYIGDKVNIAGRNLTYAIKDLILINKNKMDNTPRTK